MSTYERPLNMHVDPEPDWCIRLEYEGKSTLLNINGRESWKRLSALCHARYFAQRHPFYKVSVVLANSC